MREERHIGESTLTGVPHQPLKFTLKDGCVTESKLVDGAVSTSKIKDNAVTQDKLSADLQEKLRQIMPTVTLGFYTDEEDPMPLLMVAVRSRDINQTIVPHLLFSQAEASDSVLEWTWKRESDNAALDAVWNSQPKARQRKLILTSEDLPVGWELNNKLSFSCSAVFSYEGDIHVITNVVTIV